MKLFLAAAVAAGVLFATPINSTPVASAPAATVTNDQYEAFPVSAALPLEGGATLTAYRHGAGHASADGKIRLRRTVDGEAWSEFYELLTPSGYAWTPTGIAVDTIGRVYLTAVRYTSTGPSSAADFWPFLFTSDDGGRTWTGPATLPVTRAGWSYPHGLTVTSAGTVLSAQYVKSATTGKWESYYYASADRGSTWSQFGSVALPSRDAQEPALVQLDDGRIMSILRSDAAGSYYDFFYCTYTDPGTVAWTTPVQCAIHATGAPGVSRLLDGRLLVAHRGYETLPEDASDQRFPLRVAMFNADGTPYRGNIDVTGGDLRRYLYGNVVNGRLIYAAESTQGTASTVYSMPLMFPVIPLY